MASSPSRGASASVSLVVALLAWGCARPAPPPTRRLLEAPRFPGLQGRALKVQVLDLGNFLESDSVRLAALRDGVGERLAAGGVTVSADARETLVLELSSSQQPARGDEWCVHVAGSLDGGGPAYLPRAVFRSVRCATITRVETNWGAALGAAIEGAVRAASGAASEERARQHAAALADSIEDVLGQLGGAPRF